MLTLFSYLDTQAGQQVVLLEGIEAMPKIPSDLMHRVHSEFSPLLNYGPLD